MPSLRGVTGYLALFLTTFLPGCAALFPTKVPLHQESFRASSPASVLVVLLPGIEDRAEDFVTHGFIQSARDRQLPVDFIAVDAHFGYYAKRSIVARLHEDVIVPARRAGYRRIWLVGISLGGLGATLYSQSHPDEIDGILLLAPYLGNPANVLQKYEQGALLDPSSGRREAHIGFPMTIWPYLHAIASPTNNDVPRLLLGYGTEDRFSDAHRLLAGYLPDDQVHAIAGDHSWETWYPLWLWALQHPLLETDFSHPVSGLP